VSSLTPEVIRNCKRCSRELPAGALVCDKCHALVHSEALDGLAAEAKALEAKGDLQQARERWLSGLPLLPPASKQYEWINDHARGLEVAAHQAQVPESSENKWTKRLGPVGPIAVLLAKGKTILLALFKLKFLLSFAAFVGLYWAAWGMKFGIGFAVLILLHEMGHFIDIKRRGWPVEMPVFLPGLGAYVRWQALGVTLRQRAEVSLAGPLAGWVAAVICVVLYFRTGSQFWSALARTGAVLNVLNLIPIWVLDGGQAVKALARPERMVLLAAALALWLFTGESIFFLVAAGAVWCLFVKDRPAQSSWNTLAYYIAVMAALGIVLVAIPASVAHQ